MDSPRDQAAPNDKQDIFSAWREGLLDKLRLTIVFAWTLGSVVVMFSARSNALRLLAVMLFIAVPVIHIVLRHRSLPFRLRAWTAIGSMSAASLAGFLMVGLNPGPPLLAALCLVAATLLLGLRSAVGLILVYMIALSTITISIKTGWWAGPPPAESNVGDPVVWLRSSLLAGVIWFAIVYGVFFVVDTVETSLRQREDALAKLRDAVTQRDAAERAKRAAEALAQQSQKIESLGQLAAGVAHDFNNALLVIQGWNDIVRYSDTPENRKQGAEAIAQATEQASTLARQLLTFARQEVRRPKYLLADSVIAQTVATLTPLLSPSYTVKIENHADNAFFADEAQIQQLLFNLIINARDAMPDGGTIVVRNIKLAASDISPAFPGVEKNDEWIAMIVEDQGPGVDEAIRDRIFEPFFTTKEVGAGTGLGLSTVFGIVKQSGGHIELHTRPGFGSSFNVYLPAVQVASQLEDPVPLAQDRSASIERVLVLEDDKLARELISFTLRRAAISIDVVADGDEALRILRNRTSHFDVLCTDAVFPGAPLGDVIAEFRAGSPDGRVLICSGYVRQSITLAGLESGEYDFLAKPFTGAQLIEKLTSLKTE